jgi:glycolate oxidase FAD binding subunit
VVEDPVELERCNILGVTPSVAVVPGSPDEIAGILRVANAHDLSVIPAGGFTQQQTGNVPARVDVLLLTSRLTEIEHYDPADLTVGVGAGFTVSQLSSMVGADRLLFPVDAPLAELCNIGGMLATGQHGPLRHGFGGVRDFCIGLRFVSGDARRAKGGGRVVKNVAGYDLMKLLIGSQGTLGVITSASFKLFPAPRQTRTYIAEFASLVEAIDFRDQVLHSPLAPMCLELVSPGAREVLRPGMGPPAWVVCVRAAGSDAVLARYRAECGPAASREVNGRTEQELWRSLQNFSEAVKVQHPDPLLISLSLPLRDVKAVIGEAESLARSNGLAFAAIGRIGVGHVQAALWPTSGHATAAANFVNTVSGLRARLPRDASLVVQRCPAETRPQIDSWGATPTDVASMRAVKKALDPHDILNRGRFLF